MPDKDLEVFSKVYATLSDSVKQLIPGLKLEYLEEHLKPSCVEIFAKSEDDIIIAGNLENVNKSENILKKIIISEEVFICENHVASSVQDENQVEILTNATISDLQNEGTKVRKESTSVHNVGSDLHSITEFRDDPDSDLADVALDKTVTGGRRVTKSGRVVKRPANFYSVVDTDGIEDHTDGKRGKPTSRWFKSGVDKSSSVSNESSHNDGSVEKSKNVNSENHATIVDSSAKQGDDLRLGRKKSGIKIKDTCPVDMKNIKKYYEDRLPYKFFCNICSFKSKRQNHYKAHMSLHEKNPNLKLHTCDKCDYKTVRLSMLQRHNLQHVPDEKDFYSCNVCDFKSHVRSSFEKHMRKHNKKYLFYICVHCNITFDNRSLYIQHMKTHPETKSGTNVYQCKTCDYQTSRKGSYLRHYRDKHFNVRPHLCDMCGAAFKRTDALAAHKESHIDKVSRYLPFDCKICQKRFRSKYNLLEHKVVHSSDRSFQCHICGQMFKTRAVQRKHLRSVHQKANAVQCDICMRFFSTKYTLKRHIRQHETENIQNERELKTAQTLLPQDVQPNFEEGQVQMAVDEDANAIQTITISSENIDSLNPNLTSQIQTIGEINDVYIEGLENVNNETVNVVNLNGDDIRQILIPASDSEYIESIPNLTVTSSNSQSVDTSEQISSSSSKLFHSLQPDDQTQATTSVALGDLSRSVQLVSLKEDLTQLGSEIRTNAESSKTDDLQLEGIKFDNLPTEQLVIQGQIISDDNDGQIVVVVGADGKSYHLKVNGSGNMYLNIENNE